MRKVLFSIFLFSVVFLHACTPANMDGRPDNSIDPPANIYVGMSREAFMALYPEDVCFYYWTSYAFFDDSDGNPVVVYFERGHTPAKAKVAAIYAYDKNSIHPTEEVFCSLEGGMLVHEIVSYVGNPKEYRTNVEEMLWVIDDNVKYIIQLNYLNGHEDDELYLCLMHRGEGDVHSYPIGSEPWYPEK